MNPKAYEILKKHGLRTPRLFTLDEVVGRPLSIKYYLRYSREAKKQNMVASGGDIALKMDELAVETNNRDLLCIEATYDSIGGGASLIKDGFSYSEFTIGHPVALLRRGLCGGRILVASGEVARIVKCYQGWEARQTITYEWKPCSGPDLSKLIFMGDDLSRILPDTHSGLLLEWLETRGGIIFCDARDLGFDNFGNRLDELRCTDSDIIVYSNGSLDNPSFRRIDGFDIDYGEMPDDGANLVAYNGALLSHFVSRSLMKKINVILGGVECLRSKCGHL